MGFLKKLDKFFTEALFDTKWTCNACGKEIFDGDYFCEECKKSLPFNDGIVCGHCGRSVIAPQDYCLSCKERMIYVDYAKSVFIYDSPVDKMIQDFKYDGKKYFCEIFASFMNEAYSKFFFTPDYLVYPPMTKKSLKERGYNHSGLLAEKLSEYRGVPIFDGLYKKKETKRQARSGYEERRRNLTDAFGIVKENKKQIDGKSFLIIDDVLTTGSTGEEIAKTLKSAGATEVVLFTLSSVRNLKSYMDEEEFSKLESLV